MKAVLLAAVISLVGALFGINSNLDPQWLANRRPLELGRAQFEAQLSTNIRAGTQSNSTADRLRTDYDALVLPGGFPEEHGAGLAANAALRSNRPVLFFSLEMGHLELTQRLLGSEGRIDATRIGGSGPEARSDSRAWSGKSK